jgi:hypothetical protein
MNEANWFASINHDALVRYLIRKGKASRRKLRLFVCAASRPVSTEAGRAARALIERYADGEASAEELAGLRVQGCAWDRMQISRMAVADSELDQVALYRVSGDRLHTTWLVREVFGNPFRPVAADPGWLDHAGGTAGRLAREIYESRQYADLPILADALEDAGCTSAVILEHFREPGRHVLGCWALDSVLSKE